MIRSFMFLTISLFRHFLVLDMGTTIILGYTRGLWTDVQRVYVDGQRVHHLPDQTVNKDKSYTDTKGWSLSGGVSMKAGASDKGPSGEVGVNFSGSVSHTSSTTWKGQDYEIIPKPNGVWLASWLLDVDWPDYSKGWQISTAAKSSVTLDTESIWRTKAKAYYCTCHCWRAKDIDTR